MVKGVFMKFFVMIASDEDIDGMLRSRCSVRLLTCQGALERMTLRD